MKSSAPDSCPDCGTPIPQDDTNGLCPRCLLANGLSSETGGLDETIAPESSDASSIDQTELSGSAEITGEQDANEFGTRIDGYELIDEIARGGMGIVFKARDQKLNRVIALKMILSGQFASDNDVRRFYQEAESAAALDHPGIVPIYEIGNSDGNHFFAMKLIEGGSLADIVEELQGDTRRAVELISKVARAVHYAHQRGILHRDLKPANILIDADGSPVVTDLGLAKDVSGDSDLTHTGAIMGTPAYMPPEQASGEKQITTAADIYAIGAILYELLTGRTPHSGNSSLDVIRKVLDQEIERPREINAKVNRGLELICMHCLQRDPNARYSSAGALADDLESWLDGRPISVRPPSVGLAIGRMINQNLRSSVGAMILGLVIGGLFAMQLSEAEQLRSSNAWRARIYEELPSEVAPVSWWMNRNISGLLLLFALPCLGILNVLFVRPKAGTEALAIGLVSGLVMMITIYAIAIGPMSVSYLALRPSYPDTELLSDMALGSEEEAKIAHRILLNKYPDLTRIKPGQHKRILAQKIRADGHLVTPSAVFAGLVMTLLCGLLPSVGGTMFAAQLLATRNRFGKIIIPYFWIAIPITIVCLIVGANYGFRWLTPTDVAAVDPTSYLICFGVIILAFIAELRRWKVLIRIAIFLMWVFSFVFMMNSVDALGDPHATFSKYGDLVRSSRYTELESALQAHVEADPVYLENRFYAGVTAAWMSKDDEYRAHCRQAIDSYDRYPPRVEVPSIALLCLLRPDSGLVDEGRRIAIRSVRYSEEWMPEDAHWRQLSRTLAALRQGNFNEIEEFAENCLATKTFSTDERVYIDSILNVILAHVKLAKHDPTSANELLLTGKKQIESAIKADEDGIEEYWCYRMVFEVLHREASDL